jgi:hypothetical protein
MSKMMQALDVLKGNFHFAMFGVSLGTWISTAPSMDGIEAKDISVVAAALVTVIAAWSRARKEKSEANLNDAKAELLRQALGDPDRVLHALQNQCIDEYCPYRRD